MDGCISCSKNGKLYKIKKGNSCALCFVKFKRGVNELNFLKVRVDIGDKLNNIQKKEFNKICDEVEGREFLEILKFEEQ